MAELNAEQRNYIQNKMNAFLRMNDWKYTKADVDQKVNNHFVGKTVKAKISHISYGNYNVKKVSVGVVIPDLPIPPKFIKMMEDIEKELVRRKSVVEKIKEKIIFGAQADEMKELLALLK